MHALQPYAPDVVFIGGWVHALYLAEANATERAIRTEDIDVTIPHRLLAGDRPTLLDLVATAGYEIQEVFGGTGTVEIFQPGPGQSLIELDLLTEAPDPTQDIAIEGQPNLKVHGYPGQHILLDNARWMEVGPDIHQLLSPPVRIQVPTLPAYVLGKGLSSQTRTKLAKQAKDLVYLIEIVRHPVLGREVVDGMGAMASWYPEEYARWRDYLTETTKATPLLTEMVEQLIAGSRVLGSPVEAAKFVTARLRRLLGESPS
ncbi:MAG: hypothetical protein ABW277_25130 [Longimicrobiaceae bacterium]